MNVETAVRLEQARSLHDGVPLVVVGNVLGAVSAYLIYLNNQALPFSAITIWMFVLLLYVVGGSYLLRGWIRRDSLDKPEEAARWCRWYMANVAVHGLIWSTLGAMAMFTGVAAYQFPILAGAAMLATGGMSSLSTYFPAYRVYLFCLLTPTTVALLAQGGWLHFGMFLATLVFIFFMLLAGKRFNTGYIESLRLRFENLDLVRELTVQKEAAESANRAKSRFLAAASHDLRQPMYALNLYHGALGNMAIADECRVLLDNARQCATTMGDMFNVLLDMSRLDAGAVTPSVQVFPVMDILRRVQVEFEPLAREKGLSLRLVPSSCFIQSDPDLVERIVRNFVANAVRYTHAGKVLVGCRRRGDRLRVAVLDTGQGIPQDKQQVVFEEYFQLGNPERDRAKGLGLGLAIVRRLAKLLGAPINLQSLPGRGSMFAADFPRGDGMQMTGQPRVIELSDYAGDLSGRLIAVIDDEVMIRDALGLVLRHWGCRVVAAGSGDEAVTQLAMLPTPPDAIICDYRLRGQETGLEAIEKLRGEFYADIPALLVTGDTMPERIIEITGSGLPVLHKPLQPNVLHDALLAAIEGDPAGGLRPGPGDARPVPPGCVMPPPGRAGRQSCAS